MSPPDEKNKHRKRRQRVRSEIAKDLLTPKYGQKIVADKKKKSIKDMTHREFVEAITERDNDADNT